ncbi:putative 3-methyl-2-oxobutanoate hydroxymethyltransferase [Helianthus annuus]|nr:putative 3-methyl-2-oxobutanoate hydroxymethyltransferase [Helianthus annuus]
MSTFTQGLCLMLAVDYEGFGAMPYCKSFKGGAIILVPFIQHLGLQEGGMDAIKLEGGAPSRISAAKHIVEGPDGHSCNRYGIQYNCPKTPQLASGTARNLQR